jgi:protein-disulfide isomerase
MASHQYGVERGVRGTPTLFVNGERVDDLGYQAIEARIQAAAGPDGAAAEAPADGG